jgi:fructose-bisphosphate aldolase class II
MTLTYMHEILLPARAGGYAVGAFEVWDLASVQAVIRAAEELRQPVILQLGPYEINYAGLVDLSHIALDHAQRATVPVAVHLDHGDSFERVMGCIHEGFTSVMLDLSHLSYEQNVKGTQEVVRVAHACGVTVEGELGRIGGEEAGINVTDDDQHLTRPKQAVQYVRETGVDAFAVAIGNAHGFYKGKPNIRLGLLKEIAANVKIPLVLHGGTGIPEDIIRQSIALGIAKINICTEFVAAFADAFVQQRQSKDFRYNVPGVFARPRDSALELVRNKIRLFAGI